MLLDPKACVMVMVDIQERLAPHIHHIEEVTRHAVILNQASALLQIPLAVTEQYPQGLGKTIDGLMIPEGTQFFEKTRFSIFTEELKQWISVHMPGRTQNEITVVLYGIETHVCLLQSALEGIELGFRMVVVADAVSSRAKQNYKLGIKRMQAEGVTLVSTEMLLFEWMRDANHENFKAISKLVK